jgi:PEGA domain-containing protein
MSRTIRSIALAACAAIVFAVGPSDADAQRHPVPRHGRPPVAARRAAVAVRGEFIFIGGYYYDPFFAPYPWWMRTAYPGWYFPAYDYRAEVRVQVKPKEAAVYVDGFYAGIVDDFDGLFQRLLLPPGGHTIALYLNGYRTISHNLYLAPASTLNLHDTLEPLPAGAASQPPPVAPPVPPPPAGSYRAPRTPPPSSPSAALPPPVTIDEEGVQAAGFATLDLRVQPLDATVRIDGQPWVTSEEGHFMVQVADGSHRVEISKPGYRSFSTEIAVHEGKAVPLNVSLMLEKP